MNKHIALLAGDGIGPEICAEVVKVIRAVETRFKHSFTLEEALMGGCAIDATGEPFPAATQAVCQKADAIFLGAVGGPKWDALPPGKKPESGLLALRKSLELFANLRPASVWPELAGLSCLRADIVAKGVDLLVVRELTGDIYFGRPAAQETRDGLRVGYNTMIYDESEIRRIARVAFETARTRRGKVCSVDKANVLEVSRLWRAVVEETHKDYSEVALSHMYVDNAAMQLISNPSQFDVILTGNLFGDILSDESAALVGSLGMLPSASVGSSGKGLYEPIHGSAPEIAGKNIANPLASILSAALMFQISFAAPEEAKAIEQAVRKALQDGLRTSDLAGPKPDAEPLSCSAMGDIVARNILAG